MTPDRAVDLTVIVPCRNERAHIAETVERLTSQRGLGTEFTAELLFVDGLSDDGTREILDEYADQGALRVIDNPRRTTPCAFNLGIQSARGERICIVGAHARIADDYLAACLRTSRETGADNVGGPWCAVGHGRTGEAIALGFQSPIAVGGARSHDPNYRGAVDSVWGGCYRRDVFERIGLFDEELVRNQDDELNLRLTRAGGRIWQSPAIRYGYVVRGSLRGLFGQYAQYGYWKVRVIQKHHVPASWRHVVPGAFVATTAALVLLAPFSHAIRLALAVDVVAYLVVIAIGTLFGARRARHPGVALLLPAVLATFHVAYGYGFLRGIADFVLRRRASGATQFAALTR